MHRVHTDLGADLPSNCPAMPAAEPEAPDVDCFDGWSLHQLPDGGEVFASPCQRVRLHFPSTPAWDSAVTVAAYNGPTGDPLWRARFDDTAPDTVIGSLMCALAHDLAQPDRYDQQRALVGPVVEDPDDLLAPARGCPGATSPARCGCPRAFGLDRTYLTRAGWRLWGLHDDGRRWHAHFDAATPAHLIAAACHPLDEHPTCAFAPETADCPHGDRPNAPLETLLAAAREVVAETGRTSATALAEGVRARGIPVGTARARKIAALLKAERAAGLL
ncbi:DUF317 domain-containing protein [Kitasatospora sp. A2-31]|uniref:DUF317 domain-containing protein n=1 Tax=Kitasatospora sp. A2-31 TaxID=2916414 RepID=UPI001EEC4455|nr:DUF317 domain-containing protein [Kitasatospora sp. A2-31]MCG6496996.1 DUF317 domain-containing protein [Kitasatospora sp. A2-31]